MALPAPIPSVFARPAMHLDDDTFAAHTGFVDGFNAACHGGLLDGYREWLIVELDGGNNLAWHALVLHLTFPDAQDPRAALLTQGGHGRACATLRDTLERFWEERTAHDGPRRISLRYEQWLRKQTWYDSSSPQWHETILRGD